jgi:hypothetical protein
MNNINKNFWEEYYKSTDVLNNYSSFANFVYTNYIRHYNDDNIYLKIADLGCGNCNDSLLFSKKGNISYAIDINSNIIPDCSNCIFLNGDVKEIINVYNFNTLFDIVYMRWFLHAMPYNESYKIFKDSIKHLNQNGLICVEVRSLNDIKLKEISIYNENDKSFTSTHSRWLYTQEMCHKLAIDNNCEIIYCEEGYFSLNENTETQNPLLIRVIFKKMI